jgi:drug/metabolite transporter (DMT)-like permease
VINFNRAMLGMIVFVALSVLDHAAVSASLSALGGELPARVAWLTASITSSYVIGDGLFLWSALSLGFPTAQAVGAIYPLWATLASMLFFGEPVTILRASGILLVVLGVIVVVLCDRRGARTPAPPHLAFLHKPRVGLLLAFAASVFWAINSLSVARGGLGLHAAAANVIRMSIGGVACAALAFFQERNVAPRHLFLSRADYRRFGLLIAAEAGIGSTVYVYGLSHSPVAVGATLSSLAPVLSVPLAIALGWERFMPIKALAIGIVVLGTAFLVQ